VKALLGAFAIVVAMAASAIAGSPVQLYTLNCWGCHLPHAEGIPPSVPRLAHSMGNFLHIPEGRAYLVQVPGVANSPLSDQQIADVLNWLLVTFNKAELPSDFKPYTAAEVKQLRPHPMVNVKTTRHELARHLSAMGLAVAILQ
jgi:hypothetical protein